MRGRLGGGVVGGADAPPTSARVGTDSPLSAARKYVRLLVGKEFDKLTATIRDRLGLTGELPKLPEVWTFERSGGGSAIPLGSRH